MAGRFLQYSIVISVILTIGCWVTPIDEDPTDGTTFSNVPELFLPDPDTGTIVFETDDPEYWSSEGYTLWNYKSEIINPFSEWTVTVNKSSGDAEAGYGLIFCRYVSPGITGETMLVLLVNTNQEYMVGEIRSMTFFEIIPWTATTHLSGGNDKDNAIKITYDSIKEDYSVYFNNKLEGTFRDDVPPLHTGGNNGFIVIISPNDSFPGYPVHVEFTEN